MMLIVPAIVTSLVARIVTGVLAAFRAKVTVTPAGIFTVVKFNTPPGGNVTGGVTVQGVGAQLGANAPSSPVLPLLKVCAKPGRAPKRTKATIKLAIDPAFRFAFTTTSLFSRHEHTQ